MDIKGSKVQSWHVESLCARIEGGGGGVQEEGEGRSECDGSESLIPVLPEPFSFRISNLYSQKAPCELQNT